MLNKKYAKQLLKVQALLADAHDKAQEILNELQEAFDSKSEKWQESEAGEAAQEDLNEVESWLSDMERAKYTYPNLSAAD